MLNKQKLFHMVIGSLVLACSFAFAGMETAAKAMLTANYVFLGLWTATD